MRRWSLRWPSSTSRNDSAKPKTSIMTSIDARGLTDTGLTRQHNEDYFAIDEPNGLFVVADGMGGHSHGEVASKISVESILEFVNKEADDRTPLGQTWDEELLPHSNLLRGAILAAQKRVLRAIESDLSLSGMGTTVVGLIVQDGFGALAHVGDSRIYRVRQDRFELMTQDHTWVNEQVMAGFLSDEQARTSGPIPALVRAIWMASAQLVTARRSS